MIDRCLGKANILNQSDSRIEAIEAIFSEVDIRHPEPDRELDAEYQAVTPSRLPGGAFNRPVATCGSKSSAKRQGICGRAILSKLGAANRRNHSPARLQKRC